MKTRIFRSLIPLLSLFAVVGMLRALEAATTLSGLVTLPSPTFIMPGPILQGNALRLGDSTATDPRTGSGIQRPVGSFLYTRDGSTAYEKTGSGATSWEVIGAGITTGGTGRVGALNARALSLVSFPSTTFTCAHDDFVNSPSLPIYQTNLVGTGAVTVAASSSIVGSMADVSSGATANSAAFVDTPSTPFGRPDTNRWYMASRFAVITAVDAQALAVVTLGTGNLNGSIGVGICGATSTTIYEVYYDSASTVCAGTKQSTGVSFVAGVFHIFEMWGIADGKVHAAVDFTEIAGSPFTMSASPGLSQKIGAIVGNGTTAAARTLTIDWWHSCWTET